MDDDRFQTGQKADEQHEGADSSDSSYKNRRGRRASKQRGGALELLVIAVVAFALVFGIVRPFIVEAFYIPSKSMVPTLMVGDRVLANKFIYDFTQPKKGDVVVFKSVETQGEDLIKRVVATPGDTLSVHDGKLYINGKPQNEPYIKPGGGIGPPQQKITIPKGTFFVMGDNRSNSRDSRFFGPVPDENLVGQAFVTFWPPTRIGPL